jgi:hypothetical protein
MTTTSEQVIASFRKYRKYMDETLDTLDDLLMDGDYARATELMTTMSTIHARTSVTLRGLTAKLGDPK